MADKAPAFQWYPKDYETDHAVKLMTYEEEGIYHRLLDHQFVNGPLPADPTQIAKLVPKVSVKRFLTLWPSMAHKFPPIEGDGRLLNRKLQRVTEDYAAFRDSKAGGGKKSAQLRLQMYGTAQPLT